MESLDLLIGRYPKLIGCKNDIGRAADLLTDVFRSGGTLFTCGNGGSAADADHIVGELAKGFLKKRPLDADLLGKLSAAYGEDAGFARLQSGLPADRLCQRLRPRDDLRSGSARSGKAR